jgi:AmmeMemoRadiSam system protein A
MLSHSEKLYLLNTARNSISSAVGGTSISKTDPRSQFRVEYAGAFVTLLKEGELRGCMGYTEKVKSLMDMVEDVAAMAATEDPRFAPVLPDELPHIEIEISVLSPMERVDSIEKIEVGKHGLLLEWRRNRGLLLPQVPVEYGWDRETFLNQTSRKAGLSPDGWRLPEAKLFCFTAEVFGEKMLQGKR